jgi:hypothetical protein
MRLSGETMGRNTATRVHSTGSQSDIVNTQSHCYLQVRVERSVVVNTQPEDTEDIESKFNWDQEHGV